MCGDATCPIDVAKLCGADKPTLVITSPPYADARDYNDPIADWDAMMMRAFCGHDWAANVQVLINLGVIHRKGEVMPYFDGFIRHAREAGYRYVAQYVWDKTYGAPGAFGTRLRPAHEFVLHFQQGMCEANKWQPCSTAGDKTNSFYNIKKPSGSEDIRNKASVTAAQKVPDSVIRLRPIVGRTGEATQHPAQMPRALASFLIRCWQKPGAIIYEPFSGSGTTLLACENEGVRGLAMEISPAYVQMALARWQKQHPEQQIAKAA